MRTSYTQLPSYTELMNLMKQESPRTAAKSKLEIEFGSYNYLVQLLNFYDLSSQLLELTNTQDYLFYSENLKSELIKLVLKESENNLPNEILNNIYDYLSEEDVLPSDLKADTIFVFGSATTIRIEKAIKLYYSGFSGKITISGHKPLYKDSERTEAEILAEFAIAKGVKPEDIIIETQGISLPDNVKRTLDLWETINFEPKSIIVVNSPFVQRRGYIEWQKFPDFETKLYRQNTAVSKDFSREYWYRNEKGLNVVLNEFFKIRGERIIDLILAQK